MNGSKRKYHTYLTNVIHKVVELWNREVKRLSILVKEEVFMYCFIVVYSSGDFSGECLVSVPGESKEDAKEIAIEAVCEDLRDLEYDPDVFEYTVREYCV